MKSSGSPGKNSRADFLRFCLGLVLAGAAALAAWAVPAQQAIGDQGGHGAIALGPGTEVRQTGSNTFRVGLVEFDKKERTVSIPAKVRLRNEVVEYALVTEEGKAYESMFTTRARPVDIHLAFLLLGVSPVAVDGGNNRFSSIPATNAVDIEVAWETEEGTNRASLASLVLLTSDPAKPGATTMHLEEWLYNGSVFHTNGFAAQREGSIITLIRDPVALVNNPGPDRDNDEVHFPNPKALPEEGTPARFILTLRGRGKGSR